MPLAASSVSGISLSRYGEEKTPMTSRQCEIAAESYSACLLAQSGYDVFVQYGAKKILTL